MGIAHTHPPRTTFRNLAEDQWGEGGGRAPGSLASQWRREPPGRAFSRFGLQPARPALRLIGRIRNYPAHFCFPPCSLAGTYFRSAKDSLRPSWDGAFSQLLSTN